MSNQFQDLANELNLSGQSEAAKMASALAEQFPDADLIAYNDIQRSCAENVWHGFMLSKVRQYRNVRPITLAMMDLMGL